MALIKCPECNHDVSDRAVSCPYCGSPVERELTKQKEQKQLEKDSQEKVKDTDKKDRRVELTSEQKEALNRIAESIKNADPYTKKDTIWYCPVCGKVTPFYFAGKCSVCGQTTPVNTYIVEKDARILWGSTDNEGYNEKIRELFFYNNPQRNTFWESQRKADDEETIRRAHAIVEADEERERIRATVTEDIMRWEMNHPEEARMRRERANLQQHVVKCPACGSTNVSKIPRGDKMLKAWAWGAVAAGEFAKTFKCNNCGYKF